MSCQSDSGRLIYQNTRCYQPLATEVRGEEKAEAVGREQSMMSERRNNNESRRASTSVVVLILFLNIFSLQSLLDSDSQFLNVDLRFAILFL